MPEDPPPRRYWPVWIVIGCIAAGAAIGGVLWFRQSGREFSSERLVSLIETEFERLAGEHYSLAIDSMTVAVRQRVLVAHGISIASKRDSAHTQVFDFDVDIPSVQLTDAGPLDMLRGRLPTSGSLTIEQPLLVVRSIPRTTEAGESGHVSWEDNLARTFHGLALDSLLIHDLTVVQSGMAPGLPDSISGIHLILKDTSIDSTRHPEERPLFFSEDAAVAVPRHHWISDSGTYSITAGPLAASSTLQLAYLDTLAVQPVAPVETLDRMRGHRGGHYRIATGAVEARGVAFDHVLRHGNIYIASIDVDGFDIDYLEDARPPPGPRRQKWQPQRWAANLDRTFDIDTLRLSSGNVLYDRFSADGTRSGSLAFRGMYATGYHLNNLGESVDDRPVSQLDVLFRLAGTGRLSLHFELDLADPEFDMRYSGTFGPMDLQPLNDFLIPTEGLRIRRGYVENASFRITVNNGIASGVFDSRYRDLNIIEVNKASGRSRLKHRIRSFLLNQLRLKARNLETDRGGPRQGTISHTYTEDETFLHFLWFSTRSGIFSITGLEN